MPKAKPPLKHMPRAPIPLLLIPLFLPWLLFLGPTTPLTPPKDVLMGRQQFLSGKDEMSFVQILGTTIVEGQLERVNGFERQHFLRGWSSSLLSSLLLVVVARTSWMWRCLL